MKKQNIEDIFSSMENFSSVPPPELWANIEEKLDQPKKKKRAILWWSAAACLLLGLLLPSVLYFSSNTGIGTIHNGAGGNNSVVIEEHKNGVNNSKTITTEENSIVNKSETKENPIVKSSTVKFDKAEENQTKETSVAQTDSKNTNESDASVLKSNSEKRDPKNQAVAEKTLNVGKQNQFNSFSKNHNQFNSSDKNQFSGTEKRNTNQVVAEKTFNAGKQNQFNSSSKNQMPNSVFENQLNSNTASIASNSSNSNVSNSTTSENKKEAAATTVTIDKSEKAIANNTAKSNSKFSDVLSKQDSVQLAELQNMEKGILPEVKIEDKKDAKKSSAEKWALEVFAGVANSENYKNDKTLGNVNDSKQSNTYGVKTKYKINKKWAVGSGFKINELGQSVANVSYIRTKNDFFLSPGDYAQNSAAPQISHSSDVVLVSNATKNALKSENIQSNNIETGNLEQSLRYFEMPLEVSYAVFSKNKASISLNTGGFVGKLISNNVALDGNSIGENVSANDFVYGSTLSSTIQYRVYKKTNVFVEPAMNYYINPLNTQSFNQFQWGLNFGLNVSF